MKDWIDFLIIGIIGMLIGIVICIIFPPSPIRIVLSYLLGGLLGWNYRDKFRKYFRKQ